MTPTNTHTLLAFISAILLVTGTAVANLDKGNSHSLRNIIEMSQQRNPSLPSADNLSGSRSAADAPSGSRGAADTPIASKSASDNLSGWKGAADTSRGLQGVADTPNGSRGVTGAARPLRGFFCPGSHMMCADGCTCCWMYSQCWGCCPFPNAVCCPDERHCCPAGYTCNPSEESCDSCDGTRIPYRDIRFWGRTTNNSLLAFLKSLHTEKNISKSP